MSRSKLAPAALTAAAAFALYRATLLPGVDFGDTGSFQATVGSIVLTPRDGYPLYFAIGNVFLRLIGGDPAHVLNLVSAIEGAIACGLVVLVASELSGTLIGGLAAAVLFGGSYTFWSQATIAEVYALHLVLVNLTLLLLLWWQTSPSPVRLAWFFAIYALGFGNHLSMVLLLPTYTVFLLITAPRKLGGWRWLLRSRIIAMATGFALLGALQYTWNVRGLWAAPQPPTSLGDAFSRFWFDVTKADWRDTMVLSVPRSMLGDHLRMYIFDLRQQFGTGVPIVSAAGLAWLTASDWRRGLLVAGTYVANVLFAYSYNVGDSHVFYLPSHLIVALLAACGAVACVRLLARAWPDGVGDRPRALVSIASAALLLYATVRVFRDYPALDRSQDARPSRVLSALTDGLDDRSSVLAVDLNWQVANGLSYFTKEVRPRVATIRAAEMLPYAPALIHDNAAIGRQIVATGRAQRLLQTAYGPLLSTPADDRVAPPRWVDVVSTIPAGTRYAMCILKPTRENVLDSDDVAAALRALTGGAVRTLPAGDYTALSGRVGEPPLLAVGSDDPFTRSLAIDGTPVEIRMESWLAADTIRRMGFGHVIAGRRHTLIIERGMSLAAFDERGAATHTVYAAGIFAFEPRYVVRFARAIVGP